MQMLVESTPDRLTARGDLLSIRERIATLETEMMSKHPIYDSASRLVITGQLMELRRMEGRLSSDQSYFTRTG